MVIRPAEEVHRPISLRPHSSSSHVAGSLAEGQALEAGDSGVDGHAEAASLALEVLRPALDLVNQAEGNGL
jgi:hypothetical protein